MNNQRGQSIILMVAGISAFLIALPLGLTAYWRNNLVAAARAREAYNLMNAVEQAARDVRTDWDIAAGSIIPGPSPSPTPSAVQIRNYVLTAMPSAAPAQAVPDPNCAGDCALANSGQVPTLCYPNASNPGSPYCFYGTLMSPNALYLELKIPNQEKPDFLEKTGYKIAQALDYLHIKKNDSGLLFEKTALAAPGAHTDNTGAVPACTAASANPACMTCGVGAGTAVGTHRPCTLIYACPLSFPACGAYDGTAANAIFSQQFFVLPDGDQN